MPWRNMRAMKWHREHLPDPLPAEPLELAASWLGEATRNKVQPNPNAMVLATTDASGHPSARVVLCKEIVPQPGYLSFYTNYHSRKGRDLHDNPRAAIVLHWDTLHRQVRVEGRIAQMSAAESDAYFATRNWQSRLGAWASQQSEPIGSRAELLGKVTKAALRLALPAPADEQQPDPGCAHRPPAALGRVPAVGRGGGTVGRGQRAHPRSGALAAGARRCVPRAWPARGRSPGSSPSVCAKAVRFHVAQHPPCDPGRYPVLCGGQQLAGSAPRDQLGAARYASVPSRGRCRRQRCGRRPTSAA